MFLRIFIIIAVLNFSECRRCHSHRSLTIHRDSAESEETEDIFDSIADFVSDIDEELEKTCRFESITAVDKLDENGYTRKIIMAGFNPETVTIKIKQRVMYTKVDHLYTGRRSLKDIKILPLNLNTTESVYVIKNDALYVNIPYLEDYVDFCHHKPNDSVIYVPILLSENNIDSQSNSQNANYDIDPRYLSGSEPLYRRSQT